MTQLLDGLENAGWVQRVKHPDDRRKLTVELTSKAHRILDDFLPRHSQRLTQLLNRLSRADRERLIELLGDIEASLDAE